MPVFMQIYQYIHLLLVYVLHIYIRCGVNFYGLFWLCINSMFTQKKIGKKYYTPSAPHCDDKKTQSTS